MDVSNTEIVEKFKGCRSIYAPLLEMLELGVAIINKRTSIFYRCSVCTQNHFVEVPLRCHKCFEQFNSFNSLDNHICTLNELKGISQPNDGPTDDIDEPKRPQIQSNKKNDFLIDTSKVVCTPNTLNIDNPKHSEVTLIQRKVMTEKHRDTNISLEDWRHMHGYDIRYKPFKCDLCDKRYYQYRSLFHHKNSHTGETPFQCTLCGVGFGVPSGLRSHMQRHHTTVKPYQCQYCDKAFVAPNNLSVHVRTHLDLRPYVCEQCGMAFRQIGALKNHQYRHLGKKLFKCKICEESFAQPNALRSHMKNRHHVVFNVSCVKPTYFKK